MTTAYPKLLRETRALTEAEAIGILKKEKYGVLSTCGAVGAYGAPINHVYADGHIYLHCAAEGHKLDNIASDNRVCFTVVESCPIIVPEGLTTSYRSVVVFGTATVLAGEGARKPLIALCEALVPGHVPDSLKNGDMDRRVRIIDIAVRHITGKFNPG